MIKSSPLFLNQQRRSGQAMVEYALTLGLVVVVLMVFVTGTKQLWQETALKQQKKVAQFRGP
jgi:Flp pilus assembly pilin Flp